MEKYKIFATEEWVIPSKFELLDSYNTSSPYFFVLVDYQELITNNKICRFKRTIEKVNDESRIEDASLYITELQDNNHQVIIHSIDIIRNKQRFSVLNEERISIHQREKSLENHVTDKIYTVSLSIDDLRVGDIVDYQATTIIYADEHPLNGKFYHTIFWLNWSCPVYNQYIRITNQSAKSIDIQECGTDDEAIHKITETILPNKSIEKTYHNIRPVIIENVVPNWVWPDFMLATMHAEWHELSAYLYNYYESKEIFQNTLNLSELRITNPHDTIDEKIIKIVRFVQNDIRYKGENHGVFTHTPKTPDHILKNRYGDCKDKANLLVSLLRCVNINAHLTLVNTDYGEKINQLNPSLYHFNHMIVHIEFNQADYYFDPTIKKQAGDLFNNVTLDYGHCLTLSKTGDSLKKMPYDMSQKIFLLKHIFDFSKATSEENILTIRRVFSAYRANNMRYYLHSKEQEILATEHLKYAKDDTDLDLTITRPITIVSDNSQLNTLETEEIYTIKNLTDDNDNKLLHIPTFIHLEFPTTSNENHPLRIDLDGEITHDIEVIYKEKTDAQKYNEHKQIKNEWFNYRDSVTSEDAVIYFKASAIPRKRHVESKDFKNYLSDVEQVKLRSSNNFPYKSGNNSVTNKIAGGLFLSASILLIIILSFVKLQAA